MVFNRQSDPGPYGAWELKATYQRNMLLSLMLITIVSLALVLLSYAVGLHDRPAVIAPDVFEVDGGVFDIAPPPRFRPEPPAAAGGNSRSARADLNRMVIPEPVADSLFDELDDDLIQADRDQLAKQVDGRLIGEEPGDADENGTDGTAGFRGTYGYEWPASDSFVALEIQPEMLTKNQVKYPDLARRIGLEGSLWLQVLIDEKGTVVKAEVLITSEIVLFDEAALEAAWENKFSPGIQNGRPVAVWVKYKVDFVLRE